MGGPAMIEGGGLGIVAPEAVGPSTMHWTSPSGAVDILVDSDAQAVDMGKRVLLVFQMVTQQSLRRAFVEPDAQEQLRALIPENRLRSYNVRAVLHTVFDRDSVIELKPHWGPSMLTCLAFLLGRPVGVLANDCKFSSGAIDADAAEKATRFIQLCSAFGLPLVSLMDCPGFLVGVEAEKKGLVRRAGDMFAAFAHSRSRLACVVLRRSYGLGAMAMAGGSLKKPELCVGWPTSEYGGMQFEGAVRLGFREAIKNDPSAYDALVRQAYQMGSVWRLSQVFEVDDVLDPAETRKVLGGWLV